MDTVFSGVAAVAAVISLILSSVAIRQSRKSARQAHSANLLSSAANELSKEANDLSRGSDGRVRALQHRDLLRESMRRTEGLLNELSSALTNSLVESYPGIAECVESEASELQKISSRLPENSELQTLFLEIRKIDALLLELVELEGKRKLCDDQAQSFEQAKFESLKAGGHSLLSNNHLANRARQDSIHTQMARGVKITEVSASIARSIREARTYIDRVDRLDRTSAPSLGD